uniref:Centrosomal protein of 70 kDa n=1 Tax=Amazona collaria TaxID=241587 RepID=A0A8B9J3G7_9PSIT
MALILHTLWRQAAARFSCNTAPARPTPPPGRGRGRDNKLQHTPPDARSASSPSSSSNGQQEKAEWENLNKLLMRHGLKPVSLATPQNVIVLDSQSCLGIRLALKTLMENTDRQQKVMQGLMETNRSLRDEIQQQSGRASRQEQRANDLENVVKNIKSKICQLEDETIAKVCQQQNQVRELKKDQQASQVIQIVLSEDSNF